MILQVLFSISIAVSVGFVFPSRVAAAVWTVLAMIMWVTSCVQSKRIKEWRDILIEASINIKRNQEVAWEYIRQAEVEQVALIELQRKGMCSVCKVNNSVRTAIGSGGNAN